VKGLNIQTSVAVYVINVGLNIGEINMVTNIDGILGF
jgi:hypothetical protein